MYGYFHLTLYHRNDSNVGKAWQIYANTATRYIAKQSWKLILGELHFWKQEEIGDEDVGRLSPLSHIRNKFHLCQSHPDRKE